MFSIRLGTVIAGGLAGILLTGFGSQAAAASQAILAEGSTVTLRSLVDHDPGEVYIYVGGVFPSGTTPVAFKYFFGSSFDGNNTGYITPLLFALTPGANGSYICTVIAIGEGYQVELSSAPQVIPFKIVKRLHGASDENVTFGYINALVDSSGNPTQTSYGTVTYDYPADGGEGVGGTGTTNDWGVTATPPTAPVVTLGATFGPIGSGAIYTFYEGYRTYSAEAVGTLE
jgi:hypothetical protein